MASNAHYIPSLPEISVSVGIFSAGILAFGLAARYLPLFEDEEISNTDPALREH
jgi:Ni/Fe-hydrogenase subunit HybB-like protein